MKQTTLKQWARRARNDEFAAREYADYLELNIGLLKDAEYHREHAEIHAEYARRFERQIRK